jgi:hypothetical protein
VRKYISSSTVCTLTFFKIFRVQTVCQTATQVFDCHDAPIQTIIAATFREESFAFKRLVGRSTMSAIKPNYSKEEFARRGDALYDKHVRPLFEPSHDGQFAVIDIETGEFEIDGNELAACDRLRARLPQAQPWLRRIGSRCAHRFGAVPQRVRP